MSSRTPLSQIQEKGKLKLPGLFLAVKRGEERGKPQDGKPTGTFPESQSNTGKEDVVLPKGSHSKKRGKGTYREGRANDGPLLESATVKEH